MGVADRPIFSIQESGLRGFVSQFSPTAAAPGHSVRDAALTFNRVLQAIFSHTELIPFRFPTVVADEREIVGYIRENAPDFLAFLSRFQGKVQMEIQVQARIDRNLNRAQSGKDYLHLRRGQMLAVRESVSNFQNSLASYIEDWRVRGAAEHARCYVLIERSAIEPFLQKATTVSLPDGIRARLTGPWPVSEFMGEK